jgi:hypothetical protein
LGHFLPLPFVGAEIQEKIADNMRQSFSLRRQSEKLLEIAKRAVEIAVETSEEAALIWLEGQ